MTDHGDDCYFYYYSTCTKGDSCPFRHCEAAMGNETVCSLWQEGRCFRALCRFRHMEITKNRKEIQCYWENQPAGCQKPHCAFFHEKPRYIDGVFVPADKGQNKNEEKQPEEAAPPPAAPLPTTANPQLRGVIKTDNQEPVSSPTHPPVVINPADDDEDEDDQFSEEGEEGKVGPSPRKITRSGDSLNFGVSTLEEIRLRKALKASMKRAGYHIQSPETSANGEKENIQSFRPSPGAPEEAGRPRGSVVERLGRKVPNTDYRGGEGIQLRRSLAERLGRVVDREQPSVPPQESVKPVKERLGIISVPGLATHSSETSVVAVASEEIRIKTLEEIRQEKAAKSQSQKETPVVVNVEMTKTIPAKAIKGNKRAITMKDSSIGHVKTFSELIRAKKKRQEEEQEQNCSPKRAGDSVGKAPEKNQDESESAKPSPEGTNVGKVRVKTLEEIRREKAERLQSEKKSCDAMKHRLLPQNGATAQTGNFPPEKSSDMTDEVRKTPPAASEVRKTPPAASETRNPVKVKTFEEIMREKRLRKQELEEQTKSSVEAEPSLNQPVRGTLKRKLMSAEPSSPAPPKVPARKISLKTKAALHRPADADGAALVLDQNTRTTGAAPQTPAVSKSPGKNQTGSPERTTNCKERPKLNVKPSVVRPAVQVKPGQKKRRVEHSAVAAVKPLNSAPTVQEEPMQEAPCRDTQQVFPSSTVETQLSSAVPRSPTALQDSSSSPPSEKLQTVPTFIQSPVEESGPPVREACVVHQSPALKSPSQSRPRRTSVVSTRSASTSGTDVFSSAVDDFEELINQFSGDQPVEGVDPDIGEDDLLQELSEMIDS